MSSLVSRAWATRTAYDAASEAGRSETAERVLNENKALIMQALTSTLDECDSYEDNSDTVESVLRILSGIGIESHVQAPQYRGYFSPPPVDTTYLPFV